MNSPLFIQRAQAPTRGAIIPIMAVGMLALLMVIALVQDTGLYLNTAAQIERKADQTALAGLSTYSAVLKQFASARNSNSATTTITEGGIQYSCPNPPYNAGQNTLQAMQTCWVQRSAAAAAKRMKDVAGLNLTVGERMSQYGEALQDFANPEVASNAEPQGTFDFGTYSWTGDHAQKFTPYALNVGSTGGASDYAAYNAIKLTIKMEGGSALTAIFSRLFGTERMEYETSTVATLLPRNDVFAIDLSPSVYRDNYLRYGSPRPIVNGVNDSECTNPNARWQADNFNKCFYFGTMSDFAYILDPNAYPNGCNNSPGGFIQMAPQQCRDNCTNPALCVADGVPAPGVPNPTIECVVAECYNPAQCAGGPNARRFLDDTWRDRMFGSWIGYSDTQSSHRIGFLANYNLPDDAIRPPNSSASPPQVIHPRIGYKCRNVNLAAFLPGTAQSPPLDENLRGMLMYLGPAYDGTAAAYLAPAMLQHHPKPLWDILNAAYAGMSTIYQRGVSVDRFALVGFDDRLFPRRMTCDQGTLSAGRMCDLVSPTSPTFGAFMNATNVNETGGQAGIDFISYGLVPLQQAESDLQKVILESSAKIANSSNPTFQVAKNNILIFTDGLANCPYVFNASASGCDYDGPDPWSCFELKYRPDHPNPSFQAPSCRNNAQYILESIQSLNDPRLVDKLRELRISVSIAMIGEKTKGHIVLRRSQQAIGQCMNQSEAYALGESGFVNSDIGTYLDLLATDPTLLTQTFRNPDLPFYAPNELYTGLVQKTGGVWAAIRPPLTAPGNGARINFAQELNNTCGGTPNGQGIFTNVTISKPGIPANTPVTDSQGRLLYDPEGRTVAEQLQATVELVLQSPFVLAKDMQ